MILTHTFFATSISLDRPFGCRGSEILITPLKYCLDISEQKEEEEEEVVLIDLMEEAERATQREVERNGNIE